MQRIKKGDFLQLKQRVSATEHHNDGTHPKTTLPQGEIVEVIRVTHEKIPPCVFCGKAHTYYVFVRPIRKPNIGAILEQCQV